MSSKVLIQLFLDSTSVFGLKDGNFLFQYGYSDGHFSGLKISKQYACQNYVKFLCFRKIQSRYAYVDGMKILLTR